MTTLSIKDVPEDWAEALRLRAAHNHRSLQGELTAILEAAIKSGIDPQSPVVHRAIEGLAGVVRPRAADGRKTIEQIAQEHRRRFPEPIRSGPLAVDIVREDRDAR